MPHVAVRWRRAEPSLRSKQFGAQQHGEGLISLFGLRVQFRRQFALITPARRERLVRHHLECGLEVGPIAAGDKAGSVEERTGRPAGSSISPWPCAASTACHCAEHFVPCLKCACAMYLALAAHRRSRRATGMHCCPVTPTVRWTTIVAVRGEQSRFGTSRARSKRDSGARKSLHRPFSESRRGVRCQYIGVVDRGKRRQHLRRIT